MRGCNQQDICWYQQEVSCNQQDTFKASHLRHLLAQVAKGVGVGEYTAVSPSFDSHG